MTTWSRGNDTKLLLLFTEGKANPSNLNQKAMEEVCSRNFVEFLYEIFSALYCKKCCKWNLEQTLAGKRQHQRAQSKWDTFCVLSDYQMECKHCLCCLPFAALGVNKKVNQEAKQKLDNSARTSKRIGKESKKTAETRITQTKKIQKKELR